MIANSVLEAEFDRDVRRILVDEKPYGMCSTRLLIMLNRYGAVETAHRLLEYDREYPETTFSYLREIGKTELSVEHFVLQEKYKELFSELERELAQFRLDRG